MNEALNDSGDLHRESRMRFLGLDDQSGDRLRSLWTVIEPHLSTILDSFYGHALNEPELAHRLGGSVPRLKAVQASHWERLFNGRFENEYMESVRKIGLVHNRIGLEPRWYIGSYSYVVSLFATVAVDAYRDDPGALSAALRTLISAAMLDIDLALSVYQGERFKTALQNMAQGLSMADARGRVTVYNDQLIDMLRLPQNALRTDGTLAEALGHSPVFGSAESAKHAVKALRDLLESRHPSVVNQELADGRVIAVAHEPLDDGGSVDTFTDMTEPLKATAQIAHMALHDALTDLPNRILLRQRLQDALHRVERGDRCAVLCVDLDRFKTVNDTLGHPVGDALLMSVAKRLSLSVRPTDTVARLGGDEFVIIQSSINQPVDATSLADRLLREFDQPIDVQGYQVVTALSIGIALAPDDGADADELLKNADLALHRAKSEGRGRYCYFEAEMDAMMQARRLLELDLRKALIAKEFVLYYQPIVDVKSGAICGFEALLRWFCPRRGLVPPAEFVPLAEEIGLIVDIGAWVLKSACLEATSWSDNIKIAVNVSAVQFKGFGLVEAVRSALEASGLRPDRLEIEITESVLIADSAHASEVLKRLKALGVIISMDDFGTGYSSLSYLRSFPFDKIKIDQSFIRGLGREADCNAIVQAVMGICESLGIIATAEGVETEEQMVMLRLQKCHQVQGYLFSKPQPSESIRSLMAAPVEASIALSA